MDDKSNLELIRQALTPADGKVVRLRFYDYGPFYEREPMTEMLETLEKRIWQHSVAEVLGDTSMMINPLERLAIRLLMESAGITR
jgi:hypothetical protein